MAMWESKDSELHEARDKKLRELEDLNVQRKKIVVKFHALKTPSLTKARLAYLAGNDDA